MPRVTRDHARRAIAALVALLATGGLVALSYVPYTPHGGAGALVRLSWRARGERVESCRVLTDEELRNLPAHMRQREVCEGVTAPYRLRLYLGGDLRVDDSVGGSGARRDGLLYVFREIELPAGAHGVRVVFERVMSGEREDEREDERDTERARDRARRDDRERDSDRSRRRSEELPRQLELRVDAALAPREVLLVTYDPARRALVTLR